MNQIVTLQQILDAREYRSKIQRQYIDKYNCPVLCLTVVAVGNVKRTEQSTFLFRQGIIAIKETFPEIIEEFCAEEDSGLYAIFACKGQAGRLKRKAIVLEELLPLGRLFDIDVIDESGKPLSRTDLGYPARKCLLCDSQAAVCVRDRRHSPDQIQRKINQIITTAKE